jgi:glycosyltransferase involved in cell wall biosynthesis
MKKISAVMCTYGRFHFVERQINNFLRQTYRSKELIIYNTDDESPYELNPYMQQFGVKVINNNIDYITGEPYTNVGAIRRDALTHASGDYYICFDDDDVHLPWFMQQGIDRIEQTGLPFFKPKMSFFHSGNHLRLVKNTMEASVLCDMDKVREYGFLLETGKEGLGWYTQARDKRELDENDDYFIPSYCFDWNSNPTNSFQHRQSGDIDNPNNFENHKNNCTDRVNGRVPHFFTNELMQQLYEPYFNFLELNRADFPPELYSKYVTEYLYSSQTFRL